MDCKHEKVMVTPGKIDKHGPEGLSIDLEGGSMQCRNCHEELPFEDLALYAEQNVTVGIPTDLVDEP